MKVNLGRYPKTEMTKRTLKVQIDRWDTWDAYTTMSYIIHPLLVQFKQVNNGHPCEMTSEEWDGMLDKMIFSFESSIEKCGLSEQPISFRAWPTYAQERWGEIS